ncbi:hypothetical protein B7Z28_02130 [Candidatus Saccharibacteria bacterium 32-45-3]|nr:MAG: hypothetical protein B7Z28_02130 [Candidatus Saccharibacteria bacterium 32-45-3]
MVAKKATTSTKRNTKSPSKATATEAKVSASKPPRRNSLRSLNFTRMPVLGAAVAEFLGTFMLGAVIVSIRNEPLWIMFALVGIVLTVGAISGAHLNPAISIAAWVTKRISAVRALVYVIAQILGAMLALVIATAYVDAAPDQSAMFGQPAAEVFKAAAIPEAKEWGIFFAELLGATLFGFVFASAYKKRGHIVAYALTIGFGFFVAMTIAGTLAAYLGGSTILNPATAISLQALTFDVWPLAAYLLAPVLGAVLGFALRDLLSTADTLADKHPVVKL